MNKGILGYCLILPGHRELSIASLLSADFVENIEKETVERREKMPRYKIFPFLLSTYAFARFSTNSLGSVWPLMNSQLRHYVQTELFLVERTFIINLLTVECKDLSRQSTAYIIAFHSGFAGINFIEIHTTGIESTSQQILLHSLCELLKE